MERAWQELVDAVSGGEKRALGRLITRVENREPGWQDAMKALYPRTGTAPVVGITGPPGAGKSSLTNRIAAILLEQGRRVGIIAVDPTSPFSGGALLGDRLRMRDVATAPASSSVPWPRAGRWVGSAREPATWRAFSTPRATRSS